MRYNPILLIIGCWGLGATAVAGPPPVSMDVDRLRADGFVSIFDGETLDGWQRKGGEGTYRVEDRCIVGVGDKVRDNTFLCTKKAFGRHPGRSTAAT